MKKTCTGFQAHTQYITWITDEIVHVISLVFL